MIGRRIRIALATAALSVGLATAAKATTFDVYFGFDVPPGKVAPTRVTIKLDGPAEIVPLDITLLDGYEGWSFGTFNGPVYSALAEINEDFFPPPDGETYYYFYNFQFTRLSANVYQAELPVLNYRYVLDNGQVNRSNVLSSSLEGRFESDLPFTYSVTAQAIPEPATWALTILGFGGVGLVIRRRSAAPVAKA